MPVLVEICVDSVAGAAAAAAAGAARVELCASLVEGGTTPSYGTIKLARQALSNGTQLMVLVRPRGGDFVYSEAELQVMLEDIRACAQLGADGVVSGCLSPDGTVDAPHTARLLAETQAAGLAFTFHRAFDMSRDLGESLEQLIKLVVPRVLTSGGWPTALEGSAVIASLVRQAAGRIIVLAGGGVRASNVAQLAQATGVSEVHSSARCSIHSQMRFRPDGLTLCGAGPSDWGWGATDPAAAAAVVAAAAAAAAASAAAAGPGAVAGAGAAPGTAPGSAAAAAANAARSGAGS